MPQVVTILIIYQYYRYMKVWHVSNQEPKIKQVLIKFGYSEKIADKVEAWYKAST